MYRGKEKGPQGRNFLSSILCGKKWRQNWICSMEAKQRSNTHCPVIQWFKGNLWNQSAFFDSFGKPPPLPLTHTFRVNPVVRPMLTPLITVHDHSPSWLGTSTLIKKNGSAKLVLWAKPLKSLTKRLYTNVILMPSLVLHKVFWGRRGRDRMVIGFTTTYSISVYHHWCCEFESRSERGVQHYVIKFVSDYHLRQVGGFLRVLRFPPPIKLTATI